MQLLWHYYGILGDQIVHCLLMYNNREVLVKLWAHPLAFIMVPMHELTNKCCSTDLLNRAEMEMGKSDWYMPCYWTIICHSSHLVLCYLQRTQCRDICIHFKIFLEFKFLPGIIS